MSGYFRNLTVKTLCLKEVRHGLLAEGGSMQQGLAGILPLVVALLMGIVGGAVLVNMLLGARVRALITDTHSNSGMETIGLNKLVPPESHGALPDQEQIKELQTKLADTEAQVKSTEERCTQLEEKCALLEDKAAQAEEKCTKLQETAGQSEDPSTKISSLQDEVSALQTRLQEEGTRASTLSEQAARVSDLEQKEKDRSAEIENLKNEISRFEQRQKEDSSEIARLKQEVSEFEHTHKEDSGEIDRLKQELSGFREKWEASVGHIEEQQKAIDRIEAEKAEWFSKRDQLLQEHEGLRANLTDLNGLLDAEHEQTAEKLVLLEKAKEQLSITFKCLASEMVKEQAVGQS